MRADTKVEENAIGMEFANGGSGGSVCKGGFEVLQAGGAEAAAGRSERFRIAVDAEYGGARVPQDSGVAAAAERPVDRAPAPGCPRPDGFREDRQVVGDRSSRRHAP